MSFNLKMLEISNFQQKNQIKNIVKNFRTTPIMIISGILIIIGMFKPIFRLYYEYEIWGTTDTFIYLMFVFGIIGFFTCITINTWQEYIIADNKLKKYQSNINNQIETLEQKMQTKNLKLDVSMEKYDAYLWTGIMLLLIAVLIYSGILYITSGL